MADWYGSARSNYFRVKNEGAFRKALEPLSGLEVVGKTDDDSVADDGRVGLLVTGSDHGGWPSSYWNELDDEDIEVDIPGLVAEHLDDDEVAIFMEWGAEKLRYITGDAVAVNNKGDRREVALHNIYPLAQELGPNVTEAEY